MQSVIRRMKKKAYFPNLGAGLLPSTLMFFASFQEQKALPTFVQRRASGCLPS